MKLEILAIKKAWPNFEVLILKFSQAHPKEKI